MAQEPVQQWLRGSGLERFYPAFAARRIDESKFVDLIVSDYQGLGITELKDRQKLFRLIQYVKRRSAQRPSRAPPGAPSGGGRAGMLAASSRRADPQSHARTPSPSASFGARRGLPRPARMASAPGENGANGDPLARAIGSPSASSRRGRLPVPSSVGGRRRAKSEERKTLPKPTATSPAKGSPTTHSRTLGAHRKGRKDSPSAAQLRAAEAKKWGKSRIMVCVRKRPLNSKELGRGDKDIANVRGTQVVSIVEHKKKVDLTKYTQTHKFVFDRVYDTKMSNEEIYEETCRPLVDFLFNAKGKATTFAYGQTGSGKTYTMMGPEGGKEKQNGIYVLAAKDIFRHLPDYPKLRVVVSFFEIYGGKFFDLLNGRKRLQLQEDAHGAVHTIGLRERRCADAKDLIDAILKGNKARKQAATGVHANSSRSHAILQISARHDRKGKLHGMYSFIDLAGCERAKDTSRNDRQTRIEGAEINKSLLALKECIRALDQGSSHLPFRGSKLTQVLKDSFVGNCRTVMMATIAPSSSSVENSLNTLRYADRVKEMKESKKKKKHNAYMPHAAKNFSRPDTPPPKEEDSSSDEGPIKSHSVGGAATDDRVEPPRRMGSPRDAPPPRSLSKTQGSGTPRRGLPARGQTKPRSAIPSMSSPMPKGVPPGVRVSRGSGGSAESRHHGHDRQRSSNIDEWSSFDRPQRDSEILATPVLPEETQPRSPRAGAAIDSPRSPRAAQSAQEAVSREDDDMLDYYQQLCGQILEEEAGILDQHRRHIHQTMLHVKEEMELLKRFEAKRLSVDDYVQNLENISTTKAKAANGLLDRLRTFKSHLKEEEALSAHFDSTGLF